MFTPKKFALLIIVALCLLTWTSHAVGQSGADVPPSPLLQRPHDVDRLPDGHTLIADGGPHLRPQPGHPPVESGLCPGFCPLRSAG